MRRCARCPTLIEGGSYCPACARAKVAHYNDPVYRRNRAAILAGRPRCRRCPRPASTVDHVVPVSRGGGNGWDNLQPLCASCNRRKGAA